MIRDSDLLRMHFDLKESEPIEVICNTHRVTDDHWFDMHYPFEVGILLSGRMKREYLNYEMELDPGEVWLCGMWEPHGFELLETPCEVLVLVIDPHFLFNHHFLDDQVLIPFQVAPAYRPQVVADKRNDLLLLAKKIRSKKEEQDHSDWLKVLFYELMLTLEENWKAPDGSDKSFEGYVQIHEALRMVYESRRLITTEEASSACHMSLNKFRSTFKELMDCSFSEFALHYRIRGAMTSLKNSHETHESVAQNWGFTDASHLHRYLKTFQLN